VPKAVQISRIVGQPLREQVFRVVIPLSGTFFANLFDIINQISFVLYDDPEGVDLLMGPVEVR